MQSNDAPMHNTPIRHGWRDASSEEAGEYLEIDYTSDDALSLRRDVFGVVPGYWGKTSGQEAIASPSIDEVASECARGLDRDSVIDYLAMGFVKDPSRTLFRGVRRVVPGTTVTVGTQGETTTSWYEPPPRRYNHAMTGERLVKRFWELFVEAVASRVNAAEGRPIVVSLSGGLDSIAVAAALREVVGPERILGVTFAFASEPRDVEPQVAARAARELGLDWEMVDASNDDPLAEAPSFPRFVPTTALTASARRCRELTADAVVFFGHGGDSVLAADPAFWRSRIRDGAYVTALHALARTIFVHGLRPGFGTTRMLQRLRPAPAVQATGLLAAPIRTEGSERLRNLRGPWTRRGVELMRDPWWSWILEGLAQMQPDARMSFPFFDPRLARFVATVPTAPWFVDKELLRSALRGRVSDELRLRPKSPLLANPQLSFAPENIARAIDDVEQSGLDEFLDVAAFRVRVRKGSCTYREHDDIARILGFARMMRRVEGLR